MHDELNNLLSEVKEHCKEDEFIFYWRQFAEVMGAIVLNVLGPIYREHPHLTPPEWKEEPRGTSGDSGRELILQAAKRSPQAASPFPKKLS